MRNEMKAKTIMGPCSDQIVLQRNGVNVTKMTPAEARALAMQLNAAAEEVESSEEEARSLLKDNWTWHLEARWFW